MGLVDYITNYGRERRLAERRKKLAAEGMQLEKPKVDADKLARGQGMYIGGWFNPETKQVEALMDNDVTHVLVVAPTRAGKGVGIVVPTMLTWTGSTVVHDTKPELWPMTAGWRQQMGHKVLKFDPAASDGSSIKFNPLEEIPFGTLNEVAKVQTVARMLVDDGSSKDGNSSYFIDTAADLAVGCLLHLYYSPDVPPEEKNLGGLLKLVSEMLIPPEGSEDSDKSAAQLAFEAMAQADHAAGRAFYWCTDVTGRQLSTHPYVRAMCGRMISKGQNEMGSVAGSLFKNLSLWADPVVAMNTSRSEFRLRDIQHHNTPVDLYLVVRDKDIDRMKQLTRLIVTQLITEMMSNMDPYKWRCLFMLDEFASLGKLDKIPLALTKIAGYGAKFCIILQTLESLTAAYGKEKSGEVTSNCHTRVMFSPNDEGTAKTVSEVVGKRKVTAVETSVSGKRAGVMLDSASVSYKEEMVDLLTPSELLQMHKDELIIMSQGKKPIRGRKFYFFQHAELKKRVKVPPPAQSDRLIGGPNPIKLEKEPEALPPSPARQPNAAAGEPADAPMPATATAAAATGSATADIAEAASNAPATPTRMSFEQFLATADVELPDEDGLDDYEAAEKADLEAALAGAVANAAYDLPDEVSGEGEASGNADEGSSEPVTDAVGTATGEADDWGEMFRATRKILQPPQ